MPHTIFLSYCSLDNLLVGDPEVRRVDAFKHKLAEMLEARLGRGTLLWRYLEENAPGQMLEGNTFASLDRSSILVVLASPNYCHHSPWCLRELEAFALKAMNEREGLEKGHRCRIIVVRFMPLEDAQMPRLLQGRVDLPFHAGPRLINPNAEPRNAFNNRVEDVAICIEETLQAFYGGKAEKPAPLEQDLAGRQVFLFLPEPLLWPLHEKIRLELHDRGAILLGEPIGKKDHPHTVTRLVQALALAEVVVSIGTDAKRALPPAAAPLLLQALATDGRQGLPLRWVTWLPNSPLMLDEAESAEGHQNLFKGLQERILSLPPGQGQTVSEVITDLLLKPAFPAKPMPKSSPSLQPAHNPFPGLRPYRREEAAHFHGREEEVQALLQLLGTTRFVAVMGASGSGKSSLVRCGMATALQQAGAKGRKRTNWLICTLTPGVTPLSNLVTSLHHALADVESQKGSYPLTQQEIWRTVERSGLGLARLLRQVRLPASARLLIIVDQFEEVFRNASSPGGQAAHLQKSASTL